MYLRKRYIVFVSVLIVFAAIANALIFEEDFSQGTFYRTFYNSSGFVQLNASQTSGNFSSRIIDAGIDSTWRNISWKTELCYGCELPSNGTLETGNFASPVNMTGNVLLAHMNENITDGNITDYSGYNNTGTATLFEGPEYGAAGKFNTSLDFEANDGEYINFSSPPQFGFTNQLTLESWVNPESFNPPNGFPTIIDKTTSAFSLYFSSTNLKAILVTGASNTITGTYTFSANNWYHVALTYNGSRVNLYVNGVLDRSELQSGNIASTNRALIVGSGWNGAQPNYYRFDGKIDEVAIYNRSLSAAEIREHYMRGALKLNLSARSCDDSSCSGESFVQLNGISPVNLEVNDSQYFQYKADFTTENASYTPKLYNVSIDYLTANPAPVINVTYPLNNTNYSVVQSTINYTVNDTDLDSCWYTLDNGAINNSVICGANVTNLTSNEGNNLWKVYANDSGGNERHSSVSFFVDSLPPNVSITAPANNSLLTNNTIFVNYTVSDSGSGVGSCWWTNSSGIINNSISCGTNFSFVGNEGNNFITVYSNDTLGNLGSHTHAVVVNSQAPSVSIISPVEGSVIGGLTGINLNFSVVDPGLQTCWYTLTEGFINVTIAVCQNTTFDVNSDGLYEVVVYANDSNGNVGFDSNTFTVSVDSPSITPISPVGNYLGATASNNISFIYLPTDLDLQACSLWSDTNGTYSLNQTNNNAVSGQQNSFFLNMSNATEGDYLWAVSCNDSLGHVSLTGNQTFYIDRTRPAVTLNEPIGTYTSLTNIPISLDITDASPVQCTYNVTRSTGNVEISNTELVGCSPTTFSLDIQTSYFLWMMVNDSAGNANVSRSSFTISVPNPGNGGGGSSGGGGGGGGGSVSLNPSFSLNLGSLGELKLNRGKSEAIELPVRNNGLRFLNNCRFSANGAISEWISSEDVYSLSPGQSVNYIFTISAPIDAEAEDYFVTLGVSCQEINSTFTYQVSVLGGEFELNIMESERIGIKLRVIYAIENFAKEQKDLQIMYKLIDSDNEISAEGSFDSVILAGEDRIEKESEFELPKNSIGDYVLIMEATDGFDTSQKQQQVRLTIGGIAGFAISENNLRTIAWFGLVVLLSLGVFIVIKIIKNQMVIRKANKESEREFITIDLEN